MSTKIGSEQHLDIVQETILEENGAQRRTPLCVIKSVYRLITIINKPNYTTKLLIKSYTRIQHFVIQVTRILDTQRLLKKEC